jgi:hypothetical protein
VRRRRELRLVDRGRWDRTDLYVLGGDGHHTVQRLGQPAVVQNTSRPLASTPDVKLRLARGPPDALVVARACRLAFGSLARPRMAPPYLPPFRRPATSRPPSRPEDLRRSRRVRAGNTRAHAPNDNGF